MVDQYFLREIQRRTNRRQRLRVENVSQIPGYAQHSAYHLSINQAPSAKSTATSSKIRVSPQLLKIKRTISALFSRHPTSSYGQRASCTAYSTTESCHATLPSLYRPCVASTSHTQPLPVGVFLELKLAVLSVCFPSFSSSPLCGVVTDGSKLYAAYLRCGSYGGDRIY